MDDTFLCLPQQTLNMISFFPRPQSPSQAYAVRPPLWLCAALLCSLSRRGLLTDPCIPKYGGHSSAAMNILLQIFLCTYVFTSLEYNTQGWHCWVTGWGLFNFTTNSQFFEVAVPCCTSTSSLWTSPQLHEPLWLTPAPQAPWSVPPSPPIIAIAS